MNGIERQILRKLLEDILADGQHAISVLAKNDYLVERSRDVVVDRHRTLHHTPRPNGSTSGTTELARRSNTAHVTLHVIPHLNSRRGPPVQRGVRSSSHDPTYGGGVAVCP